MEAGKPLKRGGGGDRIEKSKSKDDIPRVSPF